MHWHELTLRQQHAASVLHLELMRADLHAPGVTERAATDHAVATAAAAKLEPLLSARPADTRIHVVPPAGGAADVRLHDVATRATLRAAIFVGGERLTGYTTHALVGIEPAPSRVPTALDFAAASAMLARLPPTAEWVPATGSAQQQQRSGPRRWVRASAASYDAGDIESAIRFALNVHDAATADAPRHAANYKGGLQSWRERRDAARARAVDIKRDDAHKRAELIAKANGVPPDLVAANTLREVRRSKFDDRGIARARDSQLKSITYHLRGARSRRCSYVRGLLAR